MKKVIKIAFDILEWFAETILIAMVIPLPAFLFIVLGFSIAFVGAGIPTGDFELTRELAIAILIVTGIASLWMSLTAQVCRYFFGWLSMRLDKKLKAKRAEENHEIIPLPVSDHPGA